MSYQHILIPVDFSELSQPVIQRGKELAAHYQAKLTLLHVYESPTMSMQSFGEPGAIMLSADLIEQQLEDVKKQLQDYATKAGLADAGLQVVEGIASDSINDYAQESQVDLIILGHGVKSGLLGFLMGSTSTAVVKHAVCDVFVVRLPNT